MTAALSSFAAACWLASAACASAPVTPATTATAPPATPVPPATPGAPAAPATAAAAAAELPDGKGKQILTASCTSCHDLREVTKFRGFYSRAQWHDIVVTMVEYGADVGKSDVEVLADYLAQHLGKSG